MSKKRDTYIAARKAYEASAATTRARHREMELAEEAWVEELLEDDVSSMRHEGCTYYLSPRFRFRAPRAVVPDLEEFVMAEGEEPEDYFDRTVRREPMKKLLQRIFTERGETALPQFLHIDTTPGISVRGWKQVHGEAQA